MLRCAIDWHCINANLFVLVLCKYYYRQYRVQRISASYCLLRGDMLYWSRWNFALLQGEATLLKVGFHCPSSRAELSLLLKSLSLSWSLNKSPWSCPCDCVQFYLKVNLLKRQSWSELQLHKWQVSLDMFMYKSFCAHIALLPVFLNQPNDPSENFMLQYSHRYKWLTPCPCPWPWRSGPCPCPWPWRSSPC